MLRLLAFHGACPLPDPPVDDLPRLLADPDVVLWLDMGGPPSEEYESILRKVFRFHPGAIVDCMAERERPKFEDFEDHAYCITHGLARGASVEEHEVVELDAFISKRYLVTYHAKESRSVNAAFEQAGRPNESRRGPAVWLHAALDNQVNGIEPLLDDFERHLEGLEKEILDAPKPGDLARLMAFRRNMIHLRRWLGLQRDVVLRLSRDERGRFTAHESLLFRDAHDHLARCTEFLETYREITNTIQETALSAINNRLGENMKFLTLFSVVLLPLSLLAGIYGMNFASMPGLSSPYGFPAILGIMGVTAGMLLIMFRRKGWLAGSARRLTAKGTKSPPS